LFIWALITPTVSILCPTSTYSSDAVKRMKAFGDPLVIPILEAAKAVEAAAKLHNETSLDTTKSDSMSVASLSPKGDGLMGSSSISDTDKLAIMKEKMEDMRREMRVQQVGRQTAIPIISSTAVSATTNIIISIFSALYTNPQASYPLFYTTEFVQACREVATGY